MSFLCIGVDTNLSHKAGIEQTPNLGASVHIFFSFLVDKQGERGRGSKSCLCLSAEPPNLQKPTNCVSGDSHGRSGSRHGSPISPRMI